MAKEIKTTLDIQAEITGYRQSLADFQKNLNQLHLGGNLKDQFTKIVTNLKSELDDLEKNTAGKELTLINERKVQSNISKIAGLYKDLINKLQSQGMATATLEKDYKILAQFEKEEKTYTKTLNDATKELNQRDKALKRIEQDYRDLEVAKNKAEKTANTKNKNLTTTQDKLRQSRLTETSLKSAVDNATTRRDASQKAYLTTHKNLSGWSNTAEAKTILKDLTDAQNAYNNQQQITLQLQGEVVAAQKEATDAADELIKATDNLTNATAQYQTDLAKAQKELADQQKVLKNAKSVKSMKSNLASWASSNGIDRLQDYGIDLSKIKNVQQFNAAFAQLANTLTGRAQPAIQGMGQAANAAGQAVQGMAKKGADAQTQLHDLADTAKDIENLKNKLLSFFAMDNAARLFRRALNSAFETIKDLDKVMTEMAVVTNYQIGDLWEKLPEYTERANKLGVTIHDAYESMTIFLQQGLGYNAATELSTETLKMARIAGLDAAEATDRMTNALRGFNMELNAVNAQRVDDVYNNLAAKTAANVDEISTAMTKVASLAHNANMEFETTAAFLAQIVETTRESAETAGTALKTVVARFSEVKKLYTTGQLLGADEEGEEIDVNKVSTALRSAGIDLNKYLTGAKGLDDIFIELASKWDKLDKVQQRYIATMAAGSRQQSRFIAMMSDYKRTTELVGYAYDSAGFANEQYQKTLESLETKLNQLGNAWNTFTMGFADSSLVKGLVDVLTILITAFDNFTNVLPGITGSLVKLTMSVIAFKVAAALATTGIENLKNGTFLFSGVLSKLKTIFWNTTAAEAAATAGASKFKFALAGLKASAPILAGISLAIGGIVALWNHFKPKDTIKELTKELENAKTAAQEAQSAYSDLNTGLESIKEQQETIAGLTKNTNDWRTAVDKLNTDIQTLIDKFPELAKYVTFENGHLTLDLSGAGDVSNLYKRRQAYANATEAQANINLDKEKINKAYEDLRKNNLIFKERWVSDLAVIGDFSDEAKELEEEAIQLFVDGTLASIEDVLEYVKNGLKKKLPTEKQHLIDEAYSINENASTKLLSYKQNKNKYESTIKANQAAILGQGLTLREYSNQDIIGNILESSNFGQDIYEKELKKLKKDKQEGSKSYSERLANLYVEKYGGTLAKAKELTDDELKKAIATAETIDAISNQSGLDAILEQNPFYRRLFSTEGQKLTLKDLDEWNKKSPPEKEEIARIISDYFEDDIEGAMNFLEGEGGTVKLANDKSKGIRDFFEQIGLTEKFEEVDLSVLQKFFEKLGDTDYAKELLTKASDYAENLSKEDAEIFYSVLSSTDFTNLTSINELEDTLKAAGFTADTSSEEFKTLAQNIRDVTKATKKYSKELLEAYSGTVLDTINQLKSDKGLKDVDEKTFGTLKSFSPEFADQFVKVGKKYHFIGDPEQAAKDLQEQFEQVFDEATEQGVDTKDFVGELAQNMNPYKIQSRILGTDGEEGEEWIKQLKFVALQAGITSEEIKKLNDEQLASITYSYQEAEALGLEKTVISDLAKQYLLYNKDYKENTVLAYDQAVAVAQLNAGLDPLVNKYEEWVGVLWKANDATREVDKTTPEYAKALGEVEEAVKKVLHTTDNIDNSFFDDETMTIIENISIADSEEELKEQLEALQQKYNNYYVIKMRTELKEENITEETYSLIEWINNNEDLNTLKFGAVLDDTDFLKTLNSMLEDAKLSAESINTYFDNLGYSVKLKPVEKSYTIVHPPIYSAAGDSIPAWNETISYVAGYEVEYVAKKGADINPPILDKAKENTRGSKGGKNKNEHWKNPYDELYNLNEKINESLRTREALERRYDQLLKSRSSSMKDIREEYKHNIEALREEADLQAQMAEGRLRQIANIGSEVYTDSEGNRATFSQLGVTKYASYDAATGQITIDWPGLEELEKSPATAKKGEAAEAYISQLEEWVQSYEEVRDKLWEIEDKMEAFAQQVIDSYLNFEDRVLDAVVTLYQKQIDEYSSLSDTIKESNDKILSNLQESIALSRQIRDNTKTEEEIADKEQRLAYLQRDTSGANDLEAIKLQKEIEDARESYQDTLIDQAIEQLSKDNEKAALQREQQIEIMQATLEWEQEQGLLWDEVHTLMASAIDPETGEINLNSDLVKVLTDSEGWIGMSLGKQETMLDDVKKQIAESALGLEEIEAKYKIDANGDGMIVTDSKTQTYLSQIRDLASQYTTQQAHGSASGTSGGSGTVSNSNNSSSGGGKLTSAQIFNSWDKSIQDKTISGILQKMVAEHGDGNQMQILADLADDNIITVDIGGIKVDLIDSNNSKGFSKDEVIDAIIRALNDNPTWAGI